jgi:hypothetical protein
MTLFYDPKKRKTRPWVVFVFIIIPVVIFFIVFLFGKAAVEKEQAQPKTSSAATVPDIFNE